ncbi:MAG: PH domain-containing protein [Tannerellaceae bacterium]|nr:PH domain-containing protein [Tannerellaceae bacterium]
MDRTFKSKVGWWHHLLIWLLVAACIRVVLGQNIFAIAGVLLITVFVLHVFFNTYYIITSDGRLIARCGIFPKKQIPVSEIEALEASIFPAFSYALSLNRIIIWKKEGMWMLVSPENEKEFIKVLRSFNPEIELRNNSSLL